MNLDCIANFNEICRICLKCESNLKSLFQSEAAEMLNFIDFMKVQENDEMPNHICLDCDKNLVVSCNFKRKCIFSTETLEKVLEQSILKNKQLCNATRTEESVEINVTEEIQTIYSCFLCDVSFQNIDLLQQHLKEHEKCSKEINCNSTDSKIFVKNKDDVPSTETQCGIEESAYTENVEDELTSFLDNKTNLRPFQCTKCSQSFWEENDLDLHESTHTLGDLLCIVCKKKFRTRQMLKRHIKTHMVHKPHVCKECGNAYAESHSLTKHMRQHLGLPREKKHFCQDCGQGFSEPYYLKVHIRKHTGERPLVCTTCQKSFADPRSLKAHNMIHSGDKPYKCHICPKAFTQSVNLTKHIRVHTGEKPYVCSVCGKGFTQSSSLDKHNRVHTGEKPFACNRCPKRFSEMGTLVHHIRTHTGEKPYVCELCGQAFATSSQLKVHKRKHSGIKIYVCNVCHKDFTTPSNLLTHSRCHTGEKPFKCKICGRKFAEKGTLNKHQAMVHNKKEKQGTYPQQKQFPVQVENNSYEHVT